MNIKEKKELELGLIKNKSNVLEGEKVFHFSNLSKRELQIETKERNYYIGIYDDFNNKIFIYVDKHDYLLYSEGIWSESKKEKLERKCLILTNNKRGYKRCNKDCKNCPLIKSGKPLSLDEMKDIYNFELSDDIKNEPKNIDQNDDMGSFIWSRVKKVATKDQFDKIYLYFKRDFTYQKIGDLYGVSHKAIEKTIKSTLEKVKNNFSNEDRNSLSEFL